MGDFINSISITLLVTAMIHVINYGSSIVAIFFGCSVKVKLVGYFINISAGYWIHFWLQISNDIPSGFDRLWILINLLPNTI